MADIEKTTLGKWFAGAVGAALIAILLQRGFNTADQAAPVIALPPRPTNSGGSAAPYQNNSTRESRVHTAFFRPLQPPTSAGGVGAVAAPYTLTFTPQNWDARHGHYARYVDDLVFAPGEDGLIIPVIIDPNWPGREIYGQLTVEHGNPKRSLQFLPLWAEVRTE